MMFSGTAGWPCPPITDGPASGVICLGNHQAPQSPSQPGRPVFCPTLLCLARGRGPCRRWPAQRGRGRVRAQHTLPGKAMLAFVGSREVEVGQTLSN